MANVLICNSSTFVVRPLRKRIEAGIQPLNQQKESFSPQCESFQQQSEYFQPKSEYFVPESESLATESESFIPLSESLVKKPVKPCLKPPRNKLTSKTTMDNVKIVVNSAKEPFEKLYKVSSYFYRISREVLIIGEHLEHYFTRNELNEGISLRL